MASLSDLPIRDDLRGRRSRTAPRRCPCAYRAERQREHAPDSGAVAATSSNRSPHAVLTVNRYPDREFTELRESLARYLGHGLTAGADLGGERVERDHPADLQAFGGPGRSVLGFPPTYSMHPIIAAGTGTPWIDRRARRRLSNSRPRPRSRRSSAAPAGPRLPLLAEQPDGHARCTSTTIEAAYDATRRHRLRRRGVRRVHARGHAERAHPAARPRAAARLAHHEQGVRLRRRAGRLPGRGSGGRRRPAARAAAVPPVRPDAGGGRSRRSRTRPRCSRWSTRSRRSATGCSSSCPRSATARIRAAANFVLFDGVDDPARDVRGAARARHPDPRRRHPGRAAGHRRHRGETTAFLTALAALGPGGARRRSADPAPDRIAT